MRKTSVGALVVLILLTAPLHAAGLVEHPPGTHVDVRGTRLWVEQEGTGEPLLREIGVYHSFYDEESRQIQHGATLMERSFHARGSVVQA